MKMYNLSATDTVILENPEAEAAAYVIPISVILFNKLEELADDNPANDVTVSLHVLDQGVSVADDSNIFDEIIIPGKGYGKMADKVTLDSEQKLVAKVSNTAAINVVVSDTELRK